MKFLKDKKIFFILIWAFLLRQIPLNQSFWLDEATSGIVVRDLNFSEIIFKFLPADFHPPFYYLILKVWSMVFGYGEISLRSISLVSALGTIYILYLISRELEIKNKLIAPLLLATSGLHIYYSSEARMYALAAFFVSVTFLFFLKTLKDNKFKNWFLFSIFLLFSSATHYLTLFMIPVYFSYAYFKKLDLKWWKGFLIGHLLLLVSLLLWLPILVKQLTGGVGVNNSSPLWAQILGKTSLKEIALVPVKFLLGRINFENNLVYGLIVILSLIPLIYIFLKVIRNYKNNLVIFWLFMPLVVGAIIGNFIPVFSYFRFLFVLPAFYLLVAKGIYETNNQKFFIYLFLTINLLSSFYYLFTPRFQKEDWRNLVSFVEFARSKDSQVLFVANSQMEGYKYYSKDAKIGGPDSFNSQSEEVWLIRYVKEIFDPQDKLKYKVESEGFKEKENYNFGGIPVIRYENSN